MDGNYGVKPIQNSLERMRESLLGGRDKQPKKLYLITRQDGSQRYFRALDVEFYVDDKEAVFYNPGQFVHGTTFKNVISVEEIKEHKEEDYE